MKKSKFNLSYLNSTTGNAGYLIPFLLQPTLPNDSFRISVTSFIRAQPMLAPLMHQVDFFTQYWFVPYRLVWDEWEEFITGGEDLTSAPSFPVLPAGNYDVGTLGDYFGFPINVNLSGISVLPFRAYALIWNERYRDEDLQSPVNISFSSGVDNTTSTALLSPSWKRDYFTTARAFTQRGNQISVPIGASSGTPIIKYVADSIVPSSGTQTIKIAFSPFGDPKSVVYNSTNKTLVLTWDEGIQSESTTLTNPSATFNFSAGTINTLPQQDSPYVFNGSFSYVETDNVDASVDKNYGGNLTISWTGSYLIVNNRSVEIQELGNLDIRDLRAASALQRYGERSLLWGNRYEEFIQREFGIKPRDSRIQRPEYLGGGKGVLQISEVLQTAEGSNTGVGTMRGHGVASVSQRPIKFRSPEHGLILGLMSVRPKPVYTQGVNREFLKKSRFDFFTPELANIGMQEVLQRELFFTEDNSATIFGYSDRYQEYRYNMPKVTGEFRTTLNFWNMARIFDAPPVLNESFINMSRSYNSFKRPFASQNTHQFLFMLRNNIKAYRPIPKRALNILK